MKYKVSVIKKIAFLVMTMALAGAMVACKGAVGPAGPPGPAGDTPTPTTPTTPTPTPPPTPPPTTPPPTTPGNPTYAGVASLSVAVGLEVPIDLSAAFSDPDGDTLTFSDDASSDTAVATVALSGSTLTITAVAAGTSTISVTATDPGGLSATGSVVLTVTPGDTTDGDTLPDSTMLVGAIKIVTLGAGERLTSSVMAVVSVEPGVEPKATEWTIRAEKKGESTVRHYGTDGNVIGSVAVTVPNQVPVRSGTPNPPTNEYLTLTPITSGDDDGLSTAYISLAPFFTDPDGDALKYNFISQSPNVLFVKATKPASRACCMVFVDVLNEDYPSASIVVRATDSAGANAVGIMEFQIGIDDNVVPRHYETHQQNNGDLATIVRVHLRTDAVHDLKFIEVETGGTITHGFKFAELYDSVVAGEFIDADGGDVTRTDPDYKGAIFVEALPKADDTDPPDNGEAFYTVSARKGDPVKSLALINEAGEEAAVPMMNFEVTKTGQAVVTVSYHVWDNDILNDGTDEGNDADVGWHTKSETVNITVIEVPPYPTAGDLYPK